MTQQTAGLSISHSFSHEKQCTEIEHCGVSEPFRVVLKASSIQIQIQINSTRRNRLYVRLFLIMKCNSI